jgi:ribonuclease HII
VAGQDRGMANDIDEDDDAEHAKLEAAIQAIVDGEPAGDQAEHVALLMQWLKDQPEAEREKLFDRVAGWCSAWAVGVATREECDDLGMAPAQKLAAQRAIEALGVTPDAAVVDGRWNFVGTVVPHVDRRVKADALCLSVAAASILAKVTRDRYMRQEAEHYPHWSFDTNKGYPCPVHKAALAACKVKGSEITQFIMPSLMPAIPKQMAKACGIGEGAVRDLLGATLGDTGAAHALVMLVDALETAKQGDRIMVVAFGQGVKIRFTYPADEHLAHGD